MWTTYFTSGFTSQWTGDGIIFPDPQDLWTSVSQINTLNFKVCDLIIDLSDSYQIKVRKKKAA